MHPQDTAIPVGLCQCGCGRETYVPDHNSRKDGWKKGKPLRYVRGHYIRQVKPKPTMTPEEIEAKKIQRAKVQRDLYERRRVWYRSMMSGRSCQVCGETNLDKLEWHHRDPSTKRFNDGRGVFTNPPSRVLDEIAKCDLLCDPCHKEAHRQLKSTKP
jgi:hypothetical protein